MKKVLRRSTGAFLALLMILSMLTVCIVPVTAVQTNVNKSGAFDLSGTFYFDNSITKWDNVALVCGHTSWKCSYPMTRVENSNIYKYTFGSTWSGVDGFYFYNGTTNNTGSSGDYFGYYNASTAANRTFKYDVNASDKIFVYSSQGTEYVNGAMSTYTARTSKVGTVSTGGSAYQSTSAFEQTNKDSTWTVQNNTKVYYKAVADSNYIFDGWYTSADGSGTAVSTSAEYSTNVTSDVTMYAKFKQSVFSLTVQDGTNGTASFADDGSKSKTDVQPGTQLTINAVPNAGYVVNSWTVGSETIASTGTNQLAYTFNTGATITPIYSLEAPATVSVDKTNVYLNQEPADTVTITAALNDTNQLVGATYKYYYVAGGADPVLIGSTTDSSYTWTPTVAGTYDIKVSVSDGTLESPLTAGVQGVTVNANTLTDLAVAAIPADSADKSYTSDVTFDISPIFDGAPDGAAATLAYTLTFGDNAPVVGTAGQTQFVVDISNIPTGTYTVVFSTTYGGVETTKSISYVISDSIDTLKAELQAKINEANTLLTGKNSDAYSDYTTNPYTALEASKTNATAALLLSSISAVQTAYDDLTAKTTAFSSAVSARSSALNSLKSSIDMPLDVESKYDSTAWAAYQAALTSANAVYSSNTATKTDVAAADTTLSEKYQELIATYTATTIYFEYTGTAQIYAWIWGSSNTGKWITMSSCGSASGGKTLWKYTLDTTGQANTGAIFTTSADWTNKLTGDCGGTPDNTMKLYTRTSAGQTITPVDWTNLSVNLSQINDFTVGGSATLSSTKSGSLSSDATTTYAVDGTTTETTWTPTVAGTYVVSATVTDKYGYQTVVSKQTVNVIPDTVTASANVQYTDDGTTFVTDSTGIVATAQVSADDATYTDEITVANNSVVYFKTNVVGVGYQFLGWYNGDTKVSVNAENPYNKSITENTVLTARYAKVYTVAKSVNDGTMGTITSDITADSVAAGTTIQFTATPNTGYKLTKWIVNGVEEAAVATSRDVTVTENTTIQAVFEAKSQHIIRFYVNGGNGGLYATANGSSITDGEKFYDGDTVEFTVQANKGYTVNTFTVDGVSVTITNNKYTFVPTADVEAIVTFKEADLGGMYFEAPASATDLKITVEGIEYPMTVVATTSGKNLWYAEYACVTEETAQVTGTGVTAQDVTVTPNKDKFAQAGTAGTTDWKALSASIAVASGSYSKNTPIDLTTKVPATITGSLSATATVNYYVNGEKIADPTSWTPAEAAKYSIYAIVTDGYKDATDTAKDYESVTTSAVTLKVVAFNPMPEEGYSRILLDTTNMTGSTWSSYYAVFNTSTSEGIWRSEVAGYKSYASTDITIDGKVYKCFDVPTSEVTDKTNILFANGDGSNKLAWDQTVNTTINKSAWISTDDGVQVYTPKGSYNMPNGADSIQIYGISKSTVIEGTQRYNVTLYDGKPLSSYLGSASYVGLPAGVTVSTSDSDHVKKIGLETDTTEILNIKISGVTAGYEVNYVVANGKAYETTAVDDGYIATLTVSKETLIIPVYEPTGTATKTIYFQKDMTSSDAWDIVAYFAWSGSGSNTTLMNNIYPGQPMIPVEGEDGLYKITVPASTTGITFNSYTSGTSNIGLSGTNKQTYDTYEFSTVSDEYDLLTLQMKPNTTANHIKRIDTNLDGQPIDVYGNVIKVDGKAITVAEAEAMVNSGVALYDNRVEYDAGTGYQWAVRDNYYDYTNGTQGGTVLTKVDNTKTKDEARAELTASYGTKYASVPLVISYEDTHSYTGDTTRADGKWFYEKSSDTYRTLTLGTKYGSFDANGNFVVDESKTDYGTAYFTGTTETEKTVRIGTSVAMTSNVVSTTDSKFVGWYTSGGTLISTDKAYSMDVDSTTTVYAYFSPLSSGEIPVSHQLYTGTGSHGGTAQLAITDITDNPISSVTIPTDGSTTVRLVTTPNGINTFYTWYVEKIYHDDRGTVIEEIPNDKLGQTGTLTYDYAINYDANLYTVNFYSDIQLVSKVVKLKFLYNDRNGVQQQYVVPNISTTYDAVTGKYKVPADTINANAPYINDLFKDCTWNITDDSTTTYIVRATQVERSYSVTAHIGSTEATQTGKYNESVDFRAPFTNEAGKTFLYWKDSNGTIISYYNYYLYRITNDYEITAFYEGDDASGLTRATLPTSVLLGSPVYERVQSTDDDGNNKIDKVRTDYIVSLLLPKGEVNPNAKYGIVIGNVGTQPTADEFDANGVWKPTQGGKKILQKDCTGQGITNKERFNYYITLINDPKYYKDLTVTAYYIDENGVVHLSNLQKLSIQGAGEADFLNPPQVIVG